MARQQRQPVANCRFVLTLDEKDGRQSLTMKTKVLFGGFQLDEEVSGTGAAGFGQLLEQAYPKLTAIVRSCGGSLAKKGAPSRASHDQLAASRVV